MKELERAPHALGLLQAYLLKTLPLEDVCVRICMCTYIDAHIRMHMYTCICMYIRIHMHRHVFICSVYMSIRMIVSTYTYMYVCTYAQIPQS